MDPVQRSFLFHHWANERQEEVNTKTKIAMAQAEYAGFFANPELYKKVKDNERNSKSVSEEQFNETIKMLDKIEESQSNSKDNTALVKKRRKVKQQQSLL